MKKMTAILLALTILCCAAVSVSAAETTEASVPVVLTVINTEKPLNVTVPASMPVSVVDGYVVCANNAKITNHGAGSVRITKINVQPGSFAIGDFENFAATENAVALNINGCPTKGAGLLSLTDTAFPVISPDGSLPIIYKAKVCAKAPVTKENAATVIFTIAAAD